VFSLILTWLIVCAGGLALIYILRCACTRAPELNPGDLQHFLYPVDLCLVESLLDPGTDFALRWNLSKREYRNEQRRRIRLYRELLRRMSHNSAVLAEFGHSLFGDAEHLASASELEGAVIKVRLYAGCAQLKLRLWSLLPMHVLGMLTIPDLASLRKVADLDGLKAYEALRAAAVQAFSKPGLAADGSLSQNL
jgi:hypothetical protein